MAEKFTLFFMAMFFVPVLVFSVGFFSGWGFWRSAKDFLLVLTSSLVAIGIFKVLHVIFTKFFN